MVVKTASWKHPVLWALAALGLCTDPLAAKEPFREFLDGLRRKDMYDIAVMYCQEMAKKHKPDSEIGMVLPFEEGQSLLDGAPRVKDVQARLAQLEQAEKKFDEFLKNPANKDPKNNSNNLLPFANTNLANVKVERAKVNLEEAKRPNKAAQKKELHDAANKLFAEATKSVDEANKILQEKRLKIRADAGGRNARFDEEFKAQVLRAELMTGLVRYEHARVFDAKAPEYRKTLEDAAKKFHEIAEKRRNYAVGNIAAIYEAKCFLDLGTPADLKKALAIVDQMLVAAADETDPDVRKMLAQAMQIKVAATAPEDSKEIAKLNDAIKAADTLLGKLRGTEDRDPDFIALQWAVVKVQQKRGVLDPKVKKEADTRSRVLATSIAKTPGPYRDEARKLLATLGGQALGPPTDFPSAWDQAIELSQNLAVLQQEVKDAATPADAKKAQEALDKELKKTFDAVRLALDLRDAGNEKATIDQVNKARYLLAVVYYQQDKFRQAALVGEYLARKYPDGGEARNGANIALISLLKTFAEGLAGNRDMEARQLESLSRYILARWPEDKAADTARIALIEASLHQKKYAELPELIKLIPEDSPQRGTMEVKVGNAMWVQYVKLGRIEDGAEGKPTPEQLDRMQKEAQTYLEKGLEREKKGAGGKSTTSSLFAGLYLAQLYGRTSQNAKAMAILEDPTYGLLPTLAKEESARNIPGFAPEVYKLGLQVYVQERQDQKSDSMMKLLEDSFKGDPRAADRLTAVYYRLSLELKEDLERQLREKKTKEFQATLSSAEAFYKRIAARSDNTFGTLNLVGETLFSLGESSKAEGNLDNARTLFGVARTAFEKMNAQPAGKWWPVEDPDQLTKLKASVDIKIAKCARATGDYEGAIKRLEKVVETLPSNIDVQREWAVTYQDWGSSKKEIKYVNKAMAGEAEIGPDKKPIPNKRKFWGWSQMSKVVSKNPAMIEIYHEAWYALMQCLWTQSLLESDKDPAKAKDTRNKMVFAANVMLNQHPDAGGEEWYAKYDTLLRRAQNELGIAKNEQGLKAMKEAADKLIATAPKSASLAMVDTAAAAETTAAATAEATPAATKEPAPPADPTTAYIGVGVATVVMLAGIGWFVMASSKKAAPIGLRQEAPVSFMGPEGS